MRDETQWHCALDSSTGDAERVCVCVCALTEIITSEDDGPGDLEGQQQVARVSLSVHRLDKTKHKVCAQTLEFCGQVRREHSCVLVLEDGLTGILVSLHFGEMNPMCL